MDTRILKPKNFSRDARKEGLTDQELCVAVAEIESGLVDARLGGFLLKKRIAKGNRGKSKGFRTILAYRQGDRLVCLFLFAKGALDNITEKERLALSELGDQYMTHTEAKLDELVANDVLTEVNCNDRQADPDHADD